MPARRPVEAAVVLPIGYLSMLLIGAVAVTGNGHLSRTDVLTITCALMAPLCVVGPPLAAPALATVGWFTVAGFSRAPFGELHPAGTAPAAAAIAVTSVVAAGLGVLLRRRGPMPAAAPAGATLVDVRRTATAGYGGLSRRRLIAGLVVAATVLPAMTALLALARPHLALVDDLLIYLLAVVAVTMIGGFWPAVLAAIAAGLLLNWYFTPPMHTWTIEAPTNLLALLLFVATAVTVSSVVHLAARRNAVAAARTQDADALLALARTVLAGDDTPQAVLDHLRDTLGLTAELQERVVDNWVRLAGATAVGPRHAINARSDLRLVVFGDVSRVSRRILDGYAAQAAAACERQRLRIQAEQTEALAAANRMRTSLLAAVSHDLRTPLASVKAAVSTLRQTDVAWSESDRAALHATIEDGADRLAELIANLLDMSRIQTGAVQPFIRPIALDEVVPLAARGLDGGARVVAGVPDDLPLVNTDPVLLERALANVVANALRYAPPDQPPHVTAKTDAGRVVIEVIDHGPGIPPDQREKVFEPFQQLGDRRGAGGVGLGLAVAKGFIESLGGHMIAEPTSGGGLTMRIDLPIATQTQESADIT